MTLLGLGDKIIGIDPGTLLTGFAIIEARKHHPSLPQHFHMVRWGIIKNHTKTDKPAFLATLHQTLGQLMLEYSPRHTAIEKAFVGLNSYSALRLGEARGALMAAAHSYCQNVWEISPTQIKQVITGNGRADKSEVLRSLTALFRLDHCEKMPFDASDALACALTLALQPALTANQNPSVSSHKISSRSSSRMEHIAKAYLAGKSKGKRPPP